MSAPTIIPSYTAAESLARQTFLALMWALSYPGRIQTLPVGAPESFMAIADTLLDLETSYFTPNPQLDDYCRRTTSRAVALSEAEYILYPTVTPSDLSAIAEAKFGTMLFPDQAATLIIGCTFEGEPSFSLTGPGIQSEATLAISGLPAEFWSLRERTRRYPLGWDIFLVAGNSVIGLPRTIQMNPLVKNSQGDQG